MWKRMISRNERRLNYFVKLICVKMCLVRGCLWLYMVFLVCYFVFCWQKDMERSQKTRHVSHAESGRRVELGKASGEDTRQGSVGKSCTGPWASAPLSLSALLWHGDDHSEYTRCAQTHSDSTVLVQTSLSRDPWAEKQRVSFSKRFWSAGLCC